MYRYNINVNIYSLTENVYGVRDSIESPGVTNKYGV